MFVSENTVQDHLKSIFTKTATRSRRILLADAGFTDVTVTADYRDGCPPGPGSHTWTFHAA
jgi:hypothetical protein